MVIISVLLTRVQVTGYGLFYRRGRKEFAVVAKILKLLCVHRVFIADFAFNYEFVNLYISVKSVVKKMGYRVLVPITIVKMFDFRYVIADSGYN